MLLILSVGGFITVYVASQDDMSSREKFAAVVILGIICGVATLFQ